MNIKIILIISLLLLNFIGCSSSEMIMSNSVKQKITIDGNHEDWSGKLKYYEDEKVVIGFQNDNENLYFCLVSSDKSNAMKIMSLGLTVWFKPENGEQVIGLRYPQKMNRVAPQNLMGKNRNQNNNSDFEITINTMRQNQAVFDLVDEDEEIIYSAPLGGNDGFEIKVGAVNQQFVYEAKVPIGNNNQVQMPINIFPDEKFIIEFETDEIDLAEMKNGGMQQGMNQGGGVSGGMQGGGHKGSGMQGGRGGQSGSSRAGMEQFSFDVEVKLSK